MAYLACHNRSIHEVLYPNLLDISADSGSTFRGMTAESVELKALLSARERMIAELQAHLDHDERAFLLSLARNEPNWALLGIAHLEQLPGIRWKLRNFEQLAKANPKTFEAQAQELEALLGKSVR
ncbi:MAG: hypothetical protein IH604_17735 [Burkholderiales bacterium]|nr:hypothetical protein [Burkholderiales bacterium]